MVGNVACMGDRRGAYKILVEKREGKRHRGRPGADGRKIMGIWTNLRIYFSKDTDIWRAVLKLVMKITFL